MTSLEEAYIISLTSSTPIAATSMSKLSPSPPTQAPNPSPLSSRLQNINSRTMGAQMPIVTLPSGSKVQTGTVGALLQNIQRYDALLAESPQSSEREELEDKMRTAVPTLLKVGLFGLFTPEEWISGRSQGRRFVGFCALQEGGGVV